MTPLEKIVDIGKNALDVIHKRKRHCTYNVKMRRVRVAIVPMEKQ